MTEFYLANANIFNVEAAVYEKAHLKIRDKRISEITETIKDSIPVFDCKNKFLLPGIIDAHVHLVWDGNSPDPMDDTIKDGDFICFGKAAAHALMSLHSGITTVRDLGACNDITLPLSSAIRRGILKGSRILAAGSAIQGSYGHCPMIGFIANTKEQLIDRIKRLKGYNIKMQLPAPHWIKIMASGGAAGLEDVGPCMYSPEELEVIVYEAHRLNMKVSAHALSFDAISKCIDAGIDTIEHGAELTEDLLQKMKEKGQTWVPTLAVYKELSQSRGIVDDIIVEKAAIAAKKQKKAFQAALQIGTKIVLGSDAGSANFGSHPSAFKEMITMEEYGMSALEVIRSATLISAKELGISQEAGSLEVGRLADILILDKNPLVNLYAFTKHLSYVFKEGELIKAKEEKL